MVNWTAYLHDELCATTNAGDADITERGIRDLASLVPIYTIILVLLSTLYFMLVFGGYPSASPAHMFILMFLKSRTKISFMSIFARFMYVHHSTSQ